MGSKFTEAEKKEILYKSLKTSLGRARVVDAFWASCEQLDRDLRGLTKKDIQEYIDYLIYSFKRGRVPVEIIGMLTSRLLKPVSFLYECREYVNDFPEDPSSKKVKEDFLNARIKWGGV